MELHPAAPVSPRVAETLEEGRAMARLAAESFPVPLGDGLRSGAAPASHPSQRSSDRKGAPRR
jgi:hypothetical protein